MKEYLEDIAQGKEGWQIPVIDKIQLKSFIEEVNQTGDLSKALDKTFNLTVEDSLNTIWGRYKKRISDQVLKTLRVSGPKNKAALELFSNRVTSTLTDAIKANKSITKKVKTALDDVQDMIKNTEKYKQSIDNIINDINKAKNVEPE